MADFCHLHCHTQYSLLDGASDIEAMVRKAAQDGQPAVAITDHGNMFGAFKFVKAAKAHGVKPIIGCEFYLVEDRHVKSFARSQGERDRRYHQLLLAKNEVGYKNLTKLCSLGYVEGLYQGFPRIDKALLMQYNEGLIATSCCIGAELPQLILQGKEEEAEKQLKWWLDLFGPNYYIELQRQHGLENIDASGISQEAINQKLLSLGKKYNVDCIATNDSHYLDEDDAQSHDILLCVNTGKELSEEKRFKFPSNDFYFKTENQMQQVFNDVPEALINTSKIADGIDLIDLESPVLLPKFPVPSNFKDQAEYLRHITYEGAKQRYGALNEVIQERIDFELGVINQSGYPGYFLIVYDLIAAARKMGVSVGPGRGSAAGSVVAYCLRITNIDPLKYDLLFERFLNPDRVSMPDIDIDFDDRGRSKVIEYVVEKYGKDQVAQIITYSTMAAKSSIRDVGRVQGVPLDKVNSVCKAFPKQLNLKLKTLLEDEFEKSNLFREFNEEDKARARKIIDISKEDSEVGAMLRSAREVEGAVRNTGIHACGYVITPDNIMNHIPVMTSKDSELLVSQFDNSVAEDAGLLKMDFLGLRTLTIIEDCVQLVKGRREVDIDWDQISLDDNKTFELFQSGNTIGVFQYESTGMRNVLRELKPTEFTDLIAVNALYRPGPMSYIPNFIARKHGKEEVLYDIPVMEKYLKETYGITVYQEQVMLLSQLLANFTKGQADALRKGMGKKKKSIIDELYPLFVEGCLANGHEKSVVDKIWKDWEAFASYAFNKSHSTCYAFIGFQTAYLKAHYPAEFMAAVLSNNKSDISKINFFLRECKKMNLKVVGPSVNLSQSNFWVNEDGEIVIGLSGLRGVGEAAVLDLIQERESNGEFEDMFDFVKRLNPKHLNKKLVEALVCAGALDSFGLKRAQYFQPSDNYASYLEHMLKFGQRVQEESNSNLLSLFDTGGEEDFTPPDPPPSEEWLDAILLEKEKEVVGIYVSGHPLDMYDLELKHFSNCELRHIDDLEKEGRQLKMGGIVTKIRSGVDRRNEGFCRFTMEDYTGAYEFSLFGESYKRFGSLIQELNALYIEAAFKPRYFNGPLQLQIQTINLLSTKSKDGFKKLTISIDQKSINEMWIDQLDELLKSNKGGATVFLQIVDSVEELSLYMKSGYNVEMNQDLIYKLTELGLKYKLN